MMPEGPAQPHTVIVERILTSTPSRVFQAWADPQQRRAWDIPDRGWVIADHHQDFRVGGVERRRFGPPHAVTFRTEGHYLHIEADRLIVSTGLMHHDDVPITATLCTIDINPHPSGTLLRIIDHSLYLGSETPTQRKGGWAQAVRRLATYLAT